MRAAAAAACAHPLRPLLLPAPPPLPPAQDKPTFEYSLKKTEFTEHNEAVARARNTRMAK